MYGIEKNGRIIATVIASIALDMVKLLLTSKGDVVEVWEADSFDHYPASNATERTFYHNGENIIYFEECYFLSNDGSPSAAMCVAHFRKRMGWGKGFPGMMYSGGGQLERIVVKRNRTRAQRRHGKAHIADQLE